MRITKLIARNFRTLKDVEVEFASYYCTLSGKNNSGKSSFVKIIEHFLNEEARDFFSVDRRIRYESDATQWEPGQIEIGIDIVVHRNDDAELYFVIDAFAPEKLDQETVDVKLRSRFDSDGSETSAFVNDLKLDERSSAEILKKFRGAHNFIIHNSTNPTTQFYFAGDRIVEIFEGQFSSDDLKKIGDAEKQLHQRFRAAAKKHKEALGSYLGRLRDKYEVELSPPERTRSTKAAFSVKLTDKSVEVPISEWGAGTQNRTRALISVFGAARAREASDPTNRVTAIVVIEEPESFLHPSAQAEFGRLLNQLATELSIQIIATTHSPYMLNQHVPTANILLDRRIYRMLPRETVVVDTSGDKWMKPFAENLGLVSSEFEALADVFQRSSGSVLLVEGPIDRDYFLHIRDRFPEICGLGGDIEIVPYGGKDTLKNTALLKFVLSKFDRVYITFDLDAEQECKVSLQRLGLVEGDDFCSVGVNKPGYKCIEGLAPVSIRSKVFSENSDLVMALNESGSEKRQAKEELKKKILNEFRGAELQVSELKEFRSLFRKIARKFS